MEDRFTAIISGVAANLVLWPCVASAGWFHPRAHTHQAAGNPTWIAGYAQPSNTVHYSGYYVGGGAAACGQERYLNEGTYGWDYVGYPLPHRVMLNWWHGKKYQGGSGAYHTDGPISPGSHPPKSH